MKLTDLRNHHPKILTIAMRILMTHPIPMNPRKSLKRSLKRSPSKARNARLRMKPRRQQRRTRRPMPPTTNAAIYSLVICPGTLTRNGSSLNSRDSVNSKEFVSLPSVTLDVPRGMYIILSSITHKDGS